MTVRCSLCRAAIGQDLVSAIEDETCPGTHLVFPNRHVADYFAASDAERSALWEAVEACRRRCDQRAPGPESYEVRFVLAGARESPDVHFHVRLAPRQPEGRIDLAHGPDEPLQRWLLRDLAHAARVEIAVAFVFRGGVELVYPWLEDCVVRGGGLRIVTGDYGMASDPDALRRLRDLVSVAPDSVQLRVFETGRAGTSFHPKAYLLSSADRSASPIAYVGSSNLSAAAFGEGVEWNVRLTDPSAVEQARRAFQTLFDHPATRPLDDAWIDAYARRRALAGPRATDEAADPIEPPLPPVEPHEIQREALAALASTRASGNRSGLVVLATGLGKTWLSAFDSAGFSRVLFVAHREEILQQALRTFRRVRPGDRLGLFTGTQKDRDANVLFASIQTLSKAHNLASFDPAAFDYVVVDEFHHADAHTYRRLIRHFDPKFMLGLTATPERTDGGDLLALCDENLVYRCDVGAGIHRDRLCPFHYFGVPDPVDYANIPWRSSRFAELELELAVATRERARNALDQWRRLGGGRTLAFCVSQRHAVFMRDFFREHGVRANAVHAGDGSDGRADSLDALSRGEIEVLFAVDMFNEGLDIQGIDTVLMLRPTESKILWLQQIGRGLRKAADKTHLRIIDYIGNHRVFLNKPAALLSMFGLDVRSREIANLLRRGDLPLPPGCEVTYDLEAIELLERLFPATARGDEFREWYEDYRERVGSRPTALEAHRSDHNPRAVRMQHGSWLRFVATMGDLDTDHAAALRENEAFLDALETAPMATSHDMLLVEAMLRLDALPGRAPIEEVVSAFARAAGRSAVLIEDVGVDLTEASAIRDVLERGSIAAWTSRRDGSKRPFLAYDGRTLATGRSIAGTRREALSELASELIEWRLARYLEERHGGVRFKVLRNTGGKPILKIDRGKADLPTGWVDVEIEGKPFEANFVKEFINVVREKGETSNALPQIMYRWFGEEAGKRGTSFAVAQDADPLHGYRWSPVAHGEGRPISGDDGRPIDARCEIETDDGGTSTIVLMSRGGGRNDAYNVGLESILRRVLAAGWSVARIAVESRETQALPLDDRTLRIDGLAYPWVRDAIADVVELRKRVGRAIARVGRAPSAKGSGNANKRIRIWVPDASLEELEAKVRRGIG